MEEGNKNTLSLGKVRVVVVFTSKVVGNVRCNKKEET